MIKLTYEGVLASKNANSNHAFDQDIVVRRHFTGKKLSPQEFREFQKIVNERRPYCSSDFKKQHFIADLSKLKY